MMNMLNTRERGKLSLLCEKHAFIRRGQAYFRIVSNQVLQVIKFQYERCFNHYSLDIGLMSMYSESSKDIFSARCPLPKHSICCLDHRPNAVSVAEAGDLTSFVVTSPSDQLVLLEECGFDWLDSISDQQMLCDALLYLDDVAVKSCIWNDIQKLAPFLAIKDYYSADRVIASILNQQMGPDSFSLPPWSAEDYVQYSRRFPDTNAGLLLIHQWIAEKDEKSISSYLSGNFINNMKMGQFITGVQARQKSPIRGQLK